MKFVDLDCGCPQCTSIFVSGKKIPPKITVLGAGNESVNGRYAARGEFEGVIRYMKDCYDANPNIFLCRVSNQTFHWYISSVPENCFPGTSSDIDYYTAPRLEENESVPPRAGWVATDGGNSPPPTLKYDYHHDDHCCSHSSIECKTLCRTCSENAATTKIYAMVRSNKCKSRLLELGEFLTQLQTVECTSDQDKACGAFLRYVISNPCKELHVKRNVREVLAECKRKEIYSMLELAVWRNVCKMQAPKGISDFYMFCDWYREGWKTLKSDMRQSNSINVIMTTVIPYIDHA